MAYSFTVNQTFTAPVWSKTLFAFKELAKTLGFSVLASGTGTSGTYSAVSDLLTTEATLNVNNAWFRLQMPTLGGVQREFCIQSRLVDGNTQQVRIKYSHSSGFTSAPTGGGSADADTTPSAADEVILYGAGTDAAPTFVNFGPNSGESGRAHICIGGVAENYGFWMGSYPVAGGNPYFAWVFEPMLVNTYAPEDIDPFIHYVSSTKHPSSMTPFTNEVRRGHLSQAKAWIAKGLPGGAFKNVAGLVHIDSTNGGQVEAAIGVNPFTAKDDLFPILWARYSTSDLDNAVATAPPLGVKGLGQMMYWLGSTGRSSGDVLTVSSTRDRIVMREMCLPWDGSTPLI